MVVSWWIVAFLRSEVSNVCFCLFIFNYLIRLVLHSLIISVITYKLSCLDKIATFTRPNETKLLGSNGKEMITFKVAQETQMQMKTGLSSIGGKVE